VVGAKALCQYARHPNIGDIPIYVAHDMMWANPEIFARSKTSEAALMAGTPDYFSATGQLWGNQFITGRNCSSWTFSGGCSFQAMLDL